MLDISRDMDMIRRFLRPPSSNRTPLREMNSALSKPVTWQSVGDGFAFVIFGNNFGSVMVAEGLFEISSRDSTVGEIAFVKRPRFPTKEYELEYWNAVGIVWASFVDAFGLERLEIGDALDDHGRDPTLCAIVRYLVGQINGT